MESRRFPNRATSVRDARRFVTEQLPELASDLVEEIMLMVSELATNCVRHANADFTVTVDVVSDRLRVVVANDGPGAPELRSPTPSEPYGRGLRIVDEFSDDWGFDVSPDAGTSVWFSLRLDGDRASGATTASDRIGASAGDGTLPGSWLVTSEGERHLAAGAGDTIDDHGQLPNARQCRATRRRSSASDTRRCRKAAVSLRF